MESRTLKRDYHHIDYKYMKDLSICQIYFYLVLKNEDIAYIMNREIEKKFQIVQSV